MLSIYCCAATACTPTICEANKEHFSRREAEEKDRPQQVEVINVCYKGFVIVSLVTIMILLIYIVMILKIESISSTRQSTCNYTDVNTVQILKQSKSNGNQLNNNVSLNLDSWATQLDHYSNVTPVILKISNFTEKTKNSERWTSDPFFSFERGYQMFADIDCSGTLGGIGTHVSVYLFVMPGAYDDELQESGQWPMKGTFIIELLNQNSDSDHHREVMLFSNDTCNECAKRKMKNMRLHGYGYSTFIQLSELIDDNKYHKNDSVYIRITYSTCYSCHIVEDSLNMLPVCIEFFMIDYFAILILLLLTEVFRSLTETSKHVFGLQKIRFDLIQLAIDKDTLRTLLFSMIILATENLPYVLWDQMDLVSYNVAGVFSTTITRIWILLKHPCAVSIYSCAERKYVVVKPMWILINFTQTCDPRITAILVVSITSVNTLVVNMFNVFDL